MQQVARSRSPPPAPIPSLRRGFLRRAAGEVPLKRSASLTFPALCKPSGMPGAGRRKGNSCSLQLRPATRGCLGWQRQTLVPSVGTPSTATSPGRRVPGKPPRHGIFQGFKHRMDGIHPPKGQHRCPGMSPRICGAAGRVGARLAWAPTLAGWEELERGRPGFGKRK